MMPDSLDPGRMILFLPKLTGPFSDVSRAGTGGGWFSSSTFEIGFVVVSKLSAAKCCEAKLLVLQSAAQCCKVQQSAPK